MTDRFTQVQDLINEQAATMCNAIGILQGSAQPCEFQEISSDVLNESNTDDFAASIAKHCKDIDLLVETMPAEDKSPEEIDQELAELDQEHAELTKELSRQGDQVEELWHLLQTQLSNIVKAQMASRPSY